MSNLESVSVAGAIATLCLGAGCMNSPRNKDLGTERNQTFSGFTPFSNALVRISVERDIVTDPTDTWDFLGNFRGSTTASFNDCDGTPWFSFNLPLDMPAPGANFGGNWRRETYYSSAYATSFHNTIRLRAQLPEVDNADINTFEADNVAAANGQTTSDCFHAQSCVKDAINICKSPQSPVVTLQIPCGATSSVCCASESGTCPHHPCDDVCTSSDAICDSNMLCQTTSSLWPSPSAYPTAFNSPSNNVHHSWTHQIQGLASDGANWYFTQGEKNGSSEHGRLWKVPFNSPLDVDFGSAGYKTQTSTGTTYCWHWGDPDYANGFVYVPMEQCDDGKNRVVRFRASDLAPIDSSLLVAGLDGTLQANAPTIAVQPQTGEFFTASDSPDKIYKYHQDPTTTAFHLISDGNIEVINKAGTADYALDGIQGMAFSPTGDKLYMALDNNTNYGLLAFQVSPHKLTYELDVHVDYCGDCITPQEHEGLTVVNTDVSGGPNVGQIHLFVYEDAGNPFDGDSGHAWFKHVRVSDSRY